MINRKSIVFKIFMATLVLIALILSIQLSFNQFFLTNYYEKAKINDLKKHLEIIKNESNINLNDSEKLDALRQKFVKFEEQNGVSLAFTNNLGEPLYGLEQTFANSQIEIESNDGSLHALPIDRYRNKDLLENSNLVIGSDIYVDILDIDDNNDASKAIIIPSVKTSNIENASEIKSSSSIEDSNTLILNLTEIENNTASIASNLKQKASDISGIIKAINISDISTSSSSYREEIFYNYINSFIFSKLLSGNDFSEISLVKSSSSSEVNNTTDSKNEMTKLDSRNDNISENKTSKTSDNFISVEKVEDKATSISNYMLAMKIDFSENESDEYHWLFASLPVQSLRDASNILSYYSLYLSLFLLLLGGFLAYMFAKKMAKPILSMNDIAKKMTNLDFETKFEYDNDDEISELGKNLNILSNTLSYTLDDLKNANAKLKLDIEKERLRDSEQKSFVATLSHELKTPLMIMRGVAEGINAGIYDKEKLSDILSEISSMDHLIGEMLQFSKSERKTLQQKEINLGESLAKICKRLSPLRDDIFKKFDIESEFIISFDENHLNKILSNIYHNALRYTPSGEYIFVSLKKDPLNKLHLQIENTGVHLSLLELDKIWEPFYRVENSRNRDTGGHGLGLYIVKKLAEANNAHISSYNTDDGICFDIEFESN